jgi:Xaa-Pro aminopeptidase
MIINIQSIMSTDEKIIALRKVMVKEKIDATIISNSDPHQSEYLAPCWMDRAWISGFTGSAGIVIITQKKATLWTDSRYFIQAEEELSGSSMVLHKYINQFGVEHLDWLYQELHENDQVAIDGWDVSKGTLDQMEKIFSKKKIKLNTNLDLVAEIWDNRPALPHNKIEEHEARYVSLSREEKIANMQNYLVQNEIDYLLIPALDEIAWLLNIRGCDVEYNPVAVGYVILGQKELYYFVDDNKINAELKTSFENANITIRPYEAIKAFLNKMEENETIQVELSTINSMLYKAINGTINHKESPVKIAKGRKQKLEITHIKNTMINDAVALCHAFKWLEDSLQNGSVEEYKFGEKIAESRSKQEGYVGESFTAIVGYEGNGAIVHYHPSAANTGVIQNKGMLLVDCGGQYKGGTTDITRTITLSIATDIQKRHYTLVLKGHIALATAVFPRGTCGIQLDALARQFLWRDGLNYLHGTGHGIGYYLNVHEGPHGIASVVNDKSKTPLEVGMVVSNEPGYYLENQYGIRIENVVIVVEHEANNFLKFDTVSLFPFDINLIDINLLSEYEKTWVNVYHNGVYDKVSGRLGDEHREWLREKCGSI